MLLFLPLMMSEIDRRHKVSSESSVIFYPPRRSSSKSNAIDLFHQKCDKELFSKHISGLLFFNESGHEKEFHLIRFNHQERWIYQSIFYIISTGVSVSYWWKFFHVIHEDSLNTNSFWVFFPVSQGLTLSSIFLVNVCTFEELFDKHTNQWIMTLMTLANIINFLVTFHTQVRFKPPRPPTDNSAHASPYHDSDSFTFPSDLIAAILLTPFAAYLAFPVITWRYTFFSFFVAVFVALFEVAHINDDRDDDDELVGCFILVLLYSGIAGMMMSIHRAETSAAFVHNKYSTKKTIRIPIQSGLRPVSPLNL